MLPWHYNIPFACIFLCMTAGIVMPLLRRGRASFTLALCVCFTVTALSASLCVILYTGGESFTYQMGHFPAPWGNELYAGPLEALLATVFSLVMGLSLLGGRRAAEEDILEPKQCLYHVMLCLLLAAMLALSYTNDIFTGYVFIEISTIAACAIVMARDTAHTIVATIRYLVISLLGSGLFLIGIVLMYCITGHLLMPQIREEMRLIFANGEYTEPMTLVVGLLTVGVAIKSALFPFHAWLPQAHGSATTTSSAVLSGLVLKAYIILLVKVFYRCFTIEIIRSLRVTNVMFVLGVAGMLAGSLYAIREEHIKRMLAYSSVAQIGYIFMGIGLGTDIGVVAAAFQILAHAMTKPLLFLSAGRLSEICGHEKEMYHLRGAAWRDKLAGACFTLGGLSMIGIPLLAGFNVKYLLAQASLQNAVKMWVALLALAASSVLNALYYVPAILALWTPVPPKDPAPPKKNLGFRIAAPVLSALVLFLGFNSKPIVRIIEQGLSLLKQ